MMSRICAILLVAASVTAMARAQASGSVHPSPAQQAGVDPNIGPDLPFLVTRTVKGKIFDIKKEDHATVVILEDSHGKRGELKLTSKTHFKADKKTEYAGKKHISVDDLEIGQSVKVTFVADSGQVLEVRLTAKT